jgi:predicted PurR-regulated permease PerM
MAARDPEVPPMSQPAYQFVWGLVMVAALVFACAQIVAPFIAATIWAVVLAVSVWPLFTRLSRVLGGRPGLAAFITSLIFMLILMLPLIFGAISAAHYGPTLFAWFDDIREHGIPPPPDWVERQPLVGPQLRDFWAGFSDQGTDVIAQNQASIKSVVQVMLAQANSMGVSILEFGLAIVISGLLLANAEMAIALVRAFVEKTARWPSVSSAPRWRRVSPPPSASPSPASRPPSRSASPPSCCASCRSARSRC